MGHLPFDLLSRGALVVAALTTVPACTQDWAGVYPGTLATTPIAEADLHRPGDTYVHTYPEQQCIGRIDDAAQGSIQVSLDGWSSAPCTLLMSESGDGFSLDSGQECTWDGPTDLRHYAFAAGQATRMIVTTTGRPNSTAVSLWLTGVVTAPGGADDGVEYVALGWAGSTP